VRVCTGSLRVVMYHGQMQGGGGGPPSSTLTAAAWSNADPVAAIAGEEVLCLKLYTHTLECGMRSADPPVCTSVMATMLVTLVDAYIVRMALNPPPTCLPLHSVPATDGVNDTLRGQDGITTTSTLLQRDAGRGPAGSWRPPSSEGVALGRAVVTAADLAAADIVLTTVSWSNLP
jgi:hypothetical protein